MRAVLIKCPKRALTRGATKGRTPPEADFQTETLPGAGPVGEGLCGPPKRPSPSAMAGAAAGRGPCGWARAAMNRRGAEPCKSGQMLADGIALVLRKAVSRIFRIQLVH